MSTATLTRPGTSPAVVPSPAAPTLEQQLAAEGVQLEYLDGGKSDLVISFHNTKRNLRMTCIAEMWRGTPEGDEMLRRALQNWRAGGPSRQSTAEVQRFLGLSI
jgi:hypothetical protein